MNLSEEHKEYMKAIEALNEKGKAIRNNVEKHHTKDNVNSPLHYNHSGGIECIDALAASLGGDGFKAYCRGNVIKYLWRLEHKGKSLEDAKKARWYLNKLIERMEENG